MFKTKVNQFSVKTAIVRN